MSNPKKITMMENVIFKSTLLVPMPEFSKNVSFRWIDTFKSPNDTVDVIVFNTENVDEIKSLLEKDLAEFKKISQPDGNVKNSISFINRMLKEMDQPGYRHDAPLPLLECLQTASGKKLAPQDVIYISGVVSIN